MHPTYLPGPGGQLFSLIYLPGESGVPRKWILHLPAFAEEMNKSRAMVNTQARELARQGYAVVVPDLRGTGDSEGEFSDVSWQAWHADVAFLLGWMREQGAEEITLWGLRLGGLLALDVAAKLPGLVQELLLWQPSYSGKQAITQFLRLRMAAGMMQGQQESVNDLRGRIESGETLEVAGYPVAQAMLSELDAVEAAALELSPSLRIALLEVAADPEKPLLMTTRKLVQSWQDAGLAVEAGVVAGEAFWSTQEIASAPALVDRSSQLLTSPGGGQGLRLDYPGAVNTLGERAVLFDCQAETLVGVLHPGSPAAACGVLLVVGGPQYRVGSHRQFLLLARDLARRGVPVLRFDYRGMGDSSGKPVDFTGAADDIRAAMDAFFGECPDLKKAVIWGLCDAATASSFYAPGDARVVGQVLVNPWVRSDAGESKAYLKHYYLQRLFSKDLWSKVWKGGFDIGKSLASLLQNIRRVLGGSNPATGGAEAANANASLPVRMEQGLRAFSGRVLIILSENDLTAAEFSDSVKSSPSFSRLIQENRFIMENMPSADHTFSRAEWRDKVLAWTSDFVESL